MSNSMKKRIELSPEEVRAMMAEVKRMKKGEAPSAVEIPEGREKGERPAEQKGIFGGALDWLKRGRQEAETVAQDNKEVLNVSGSGGSIPVADLTANFEQTAADFGSDLAEEEEELVEAAENSLEKILGYDQDAEIKKLNQEIARIKKEIKNLDKAKDDEVAEFYKEHDRPDTFVQPEGLKFEKGHGQILPPAYTDKDVQAEFEKFQKEQKKYDKSNLDLVKKKSELENKKRRRIDQLQFAEKLAAKELIPQKQIADEIVRLEKRKQSLESGKMTIIPEFGSQEEQIKEIETEIQSKEKELSDLEEGEKKVDAIVNKFYSKMTYSEILKDEIAYLEEIAAEYDKYPDTVIDNFGLRQERDRLNIEMNIKKIELEEHEKEQAKKEK